MPEDQWPGLQPQRVDPPEHAEFRNLLAPLFTPVATAKLETEVRRRARELIDGFADAAWASIRKLEIAVSLREWLPRIRDFRIAADTDIEIFAGPVMGLRFLPLVWDSFLNLEPHDF